MTHINGSAYNPGGGPSLTDCDLLLVQRLADEISAEVLGHSVVFAPQRVESEDVTSMGRKESKVLRQYRTQRG